MLKCRNYIVFIIYAQGERPAEGSSGAKSKAEVSLPLGQDVEAHAAAAADNDDHGAEAAEDGALPRRVEQRLRGEGAAGSRAGADCPVPRGAAGGTVQVELQRAAVSGGG
jgi:hypothetical protein